MTDTYETFPEAISDLQLFSQGSVTTESKCQVESAQLPSLGGVAESPAPAAKQKTSRKTNIKTK